MENFRIVVDTNIVVDAFKEYDDLELRERCGKVIKSFVDKSNLMIAFDRPKSFDEHGFIVYEYMKNLGSVRDFQIFYGRLFWRDKVTYVEPADITEIAEKLDEIDFHESEDRKFLATALAADKIIVTEDSDYGIPDDPEYSKRYKFFTEEQGMEIDNSERFIDKYCL